MTLLDGMYVMVDHTPPPGNIMRAMVKDHRRMNLIEPEIRPWNFLGECTELPWKSLLLRCPSNGGLGRPTILNAYEFGNDNITSMYWVGQCKICLEVLWQVDAATLVRWEARLEEWLGSGSEKPYDPVQPLCQKPARDPLNWRRFRATYTKVQSMHVLTDIARDHIVPTFQL